MGSAHRTLSEPWQGDFAPAFVLFRSPGIHRGFGGGGGPERGRRGRAVRRAARHFGHWRRRAPPAGRAPTIPNSHTTQPPLRIELQFPKSFSEGSQGGRPLRTRCDRYSIAATSCASQRLDHCFRYVQGRTTNTKEMLLLNYCLVTLLSFLCLWHFQYIECELYQPIKQLVIILRIFWSHFSSPVYLDYLKRKEKKIVPLKRSKLQRMRQYFNMILFYVIYY